MLFCSSGNPCLKYLPFLWLCVSIISAQSDCSNLNKEVYIRSSKSLFLVEGNWGDGHIKIRPYRNTTDQKWRLQPSKKIGRFNIINLKNTKVLDLANYNETDDSFDAVTETYTDSPSQQWFIHSDGTFVNGRLADHALDVKDGKYTYENDLVVRPRISGGTESAKFVIESVTQC